MNLNQISKKNSLNHLNSDNSEIKKYIRYYSSNEDLTEIYPLLKNISGKGFFVMGGFDQVASMISNSSLEEIIIVDSNYGALEYGRMRFSLAAISKSRKEYFENILSTQIDNLSKDIYQQVKNLNKRGYLKNSKKAKKTSSLLKENFLIDQDILSKTIECLERKNYITKEIIRDISFSYKLLNNSEGNLKSFIEMNNKNWLSNNQRFENVRTKVLENKIKYFLVDLSKRDQDLSSFGNISLAYVSNVAEYCSKNLKFFYKTLNSLKSSDETLWIETFTAGYLKSKTKTKNGKEIEKRTKKEIDYLWRPKYIVS